jgi:spermidine synthase
MKKSWILKICLFVAGFSGIVAEYILSTLASYFLGDSILQWTLVLSFMLFSMGLGSSLTKRMENGLLEKFIFLEFGLSILVTFSAIAVYLVSSQTTYNSLLIYGLSILIGMLIGMEIPLVTRLNEHYEELRVNIASVMESDYYGSLVGGLFFAFVGLPILGLTYTPFVLGFLNSVVALALFWRFRGLIPIATRNVLFACGIGIVVLWVAGVIFAKPIVLFAEQLRYKDQVIYAEQSRYQKIVITQWKSDYWLFINGSQQLSTLDEVMYHEPLVHPIMSLHPYPQDVLILGGGDGCAVRDLLQYESLKTVTLVDLDPAMTNLGKNHEVLKTLNQKSLHNNKVSIFNQDAYLFLENTRKRYDVIIIDLPDPKSVELNRLYTQEFYMLCHRVLRPEGLVITQSGSPYYATKAFTCIGKTMREAGFATVQMHNQVLTLGEWGWTLGSKKWEQKELLARLRSLRFDKLKTKWINADAMLLLTSFGKHEFFLNEAIDKVEVNTIHNPVLYRYYLKGNWDLY